MLNIIFASTSFSQNNIDSLIKVDYYLNVPNRLNLVFPQYYVTSKECKLYKTFHNNDTIFNEKQNNYYWVVSDKQSCNLFIKNIDSNQIQVKINFNKLPIPQIFPSNSFKRNDTIFINGSGLFFRINHPEEVYKNVKSIHILYSVPKAKFTLIDNNFNTSKVILKNNRASSIRIKIPENTLYLKLKINKIIRYNDLKNKEKIKINFKERYFIVN